MPTASLPLAAFDLGSSELLLIATILGFLLLLAAIPAFLAFIVLQRIPVQHRKQTPGLAFLLVIPLFGLIWMFFVHPKVAESLKSYFASIGDTSHGDCGANLALWTCICAIGSFVPLLGLISGVAALVLLIMFYVKAFELSSKIPQSV